MVKPLITKDLLDYLRSAFPDKLPEQPVGADELGLLIGQQRVITHLSHLYRTQNRPALTSI